MPPFGYNDFGHDEHGNDDCGPPEDVVLHKLRLVRSRTGSELNLDTRNCEYLAAGVSAELVDDFVAEFFPGWTAVL